MSRESQPAAVACVAGAGIEASRGCVMSASRLDDVALSSNCKWGVDLELPNGRGFIALLEAFRATGGTAPGDIAERLLEEHQSGGAVSLAKLLYTGQVFGFEWRANLWIPMFQFDPADFSLKEGAQRIRAELPALWSGWTLAAWFAAPNEGLDGRSAADMIHLDSTAVIRAARALGGAREATPMNIRPRREVAASV